MIKFSCPECETPLKVADEKGGSKIACPSCKARVGVPGGALAKAGANKNGAQKKRFRDDDYEDEDLEEAAPKRKKGSSAGLFIGIGVAVLLVLAGGAILIVLQMSDKKDKNTVLPTGGGQAAVPIASNTQPTAPNTASTQPGKAASSNSGTSTTTPGAGGTENASAKPADANKEPAGGPNAAAEINVNVDADKIYQRLLKSTAVVFIETAEGGGNGSGSLVDKEHRLILTNHHVAGDGEDRALTVYFPQYRSGELITQKSYYLNQLRKGAEGGIRGWVVAADSKKDLALVKLANLPDGVLPVPIARGTARPGQKVHSIGAPGASDALWVYTPGNVRSRHRKQWFSGAKRTERNAEILETTSPTNFGDSGGPLVNDRCELVGVTQGGKMADESGIVNSFAYFVDLVEVKALLARYYKSIGSKIELPSEEGKGAIAGSDTASLMRILREEKDPGKRTQAAFALGQFGPEAKAAVPLLVACLKEKDDELRKRAAHSLENIGSLASSDVPNLCAALKDSDPDVRTSIAQCLVKMGLAAKSAVPSIIEALNDKDVSVRKLCVTALGRIGPEAEEAVGALMEVLKDPEPELRSQAAIALGKIGPAAKKAVPALTETLKNNDKSLRINAITALEGLGVEAKAAIPELMKLLRNGDKDVQFAACSALGAIGPDAKEAVPKMLALIEEKTQVTQVADALEKIGKVAVPALIKALADNQDWVRYGACEALGRIGPDAEAALPALKGRFDKDRNFEVRAAAGRAARKIKAK